MLGSDDESPALVADRLRTARARAQIERGEQTQLVYSGGVDARGVNEWPDPEVIPTTMGWAPTLVRHLVTTERQLADMVDATRTRRVAYDTETSGLVPQLGARVVGHGLAAQLTGSEVHAWYVPVRHIGPENVGRDQLPVDLVSEAMRACLGVPGGIVDTHHGKFERKFAWSDEIAIRRRIVDVAILATARNENERSFALKNLAASVVPSAKDSRDEVKEWHKKDARRLGIPYQKRKKLPIDVVDRLGEPTYLERYGYARTPIPLCGRYCCDDVFLTLVLAQYALADVEQQWPELIAREHAVADRLCDMEVFGVPADREKIHDAFQRLGKEVLFWLTRLRAIYGPTYQHTNEQIAELLYERLRLPVLARTKKSNTASTDYHARKLLEAKFPEHREVLHAIGMLSRAQKLHSTYAGAYLEIVSPSTLCVHPSYNQMEARDLGGVPVTGRLSSANPNFQNVDAKGIHLHDCACDDCVKERPDFIALRALFPELADEKFRGKITWSEAGYQALRGMGFDPDARNSVLKIRKLFPTRPGYIRAYIDFSQIELRVLAWFCRDENLLRAYREDIDVHQLVADELGISRKVSKQVNFGNSYGMTEVGLATRLPGYYDNPEATVEFAKKVLRDYFARYPGILKFRRDFAMECRRNRCMFVNPFGRPRRIPMLASTERHERERAERMMMSSIISGTAADVMKESMLRCGRIVDDAGRGDLLVQTIHDELVFDLVAKPGWARVLTSLVRTMEDWPMFSEGDVPIKVSTELALPGDTWGDKREAELLPDDTWKFAA